MRPWKQDDLPTVFGNKNRKEEVVVARGFVCQLSHTLRVAKAPPPAPPRSLDLKRFLWNRVLMLLDQTIPFSCPDYCLTTTRTQNGLVASTRFNKDRNLLESDPVELACALLEKLNYQNSYDLWRTQRLGP